jgi:hypothetical protein
MIKTVWYILPVLFLLLQACGVLFFREEDERRRQEAEFAPYQQKNTIEAYQEFIQKYPDNPFAPTAKSSIENLEFAPYEMKDSIEGYREFMKSFPANRNLTRAAEKIEQLEYKQIEDTDTVAAYREFLRQNPHSNYTMLAQQRLQDLEFRALEQKCRDQYGFDLLLYRLNASRLQKALESIDTDNLTDFTLFASTDAYKGQRCFRTILIYSNSIERLDVKKKESAELFFNSVIAKLLVYLDQKFTNKKELDGFCFTISSSANCFYGDAAVLFEYYFPAGSVQQFVQGLLTPRELLALATVSIPANTTQAEKSSVSRPAPPH